LFQNISQVQMFDVWINTHTIQTISIFLTATFSVNYHVLLQHPHWENRIRYVRKRSSAELTRMCTVRNIFPPKDLVGNTKTHPTSHLPPPRAADAPEGLGLDWKPLQRSHSNWRSSNRKHLPKRRKSDE
jgi:hypothetical protein